MRFARNVDPINFDAGDGNGIQTYQPFNFEFSAEQPGASQLPTMVLKASNTMRILQGVIEQYSGIAGAIANVYVYNTAHPPASLTLPSLRRDEVRMHGRACDVLTLRALRRCASSFPSSCIAPTFACTFRTIRASGVDTPAAHQL